MPDKKVEMVKILPKKDWKINHGPIYKGDKEIVIVKGKEQTIPKMFLENMKTEGVV